MLPAHVYSVERGRERYSMTVVDYTRIEQMGVERRRSARPAPSPARAAAGGLADVIGPGYSTQDIRGAIVDATLRFLKRDAKITHYLWNWQDLVEGHEIQLTNNADQSRTMAFIAMRENKLYIVEGTVPKGWPEPGCSTSRSDGSTRTATAFAISRSTSTRSTASDCFRSPARQPGRAGRTWRQGGRGDSHRRQEDIHAIDK